MNAWEQVLVGPAATLREALIKIDVAGTQIALVVDANRKLLGTLSDGDVRRGLIKGLSLSDSVGRAMCSTPTTVPVGESRDAILCIMRRAGLHQVPLVNADGVVVGLEIVDDFLVRRPRENWVVIMAGGLGSRLKELTRTVPKPMLRVGDRPLLETIVKSYVDQGFHRFYLAVNYKAEVIESHFGDGSGFGADIRYLRERERLGTAGALGLLPESPDAPVIVANGDLLVKLEYSEMLDAHIATNAAATMAVQEYEYQIPYGVIEARQDGAIDRIEEKPVHRSLVSAGMYVLSPQALEVIPQNSTFNMPELFNSVIARGWRAHCHHVRGYWIDVGRMSDYEKANQDYPGIFP